MSKGLHPSLVKRKTWNPKNTRAAFSFSCCNKGSDPVLCSRHNLGHPKTHKSSRLHVPSIEIKQRTLIPLPLEKSHAKSFIKNLTIKQRNKTEKSWHLNYLSSSSNKRPKVLLELPNKAMAMRIKHSVANQGKMCNFVER